MPFSARAEAEDSKLEKDRLEVFAKETLKPFEELCPRIQIPWPGPIISQLLK